MPHSHHHQHPKGLQPSALTSFVDKQWPAVQTALEAYIRIPNQSPMFDPEWASNGHTAAVVQLFTSWVAAQAVPGLKLEVLQEAGRTPLIFMEVASTGGAGTVLM